MNRTPSLRSRRGSSAAFLCLIMSALVSICFAFIYASIEYSAASRADAIMRLSGNSLLSEFDLDLLEEYGLLLLREDDPALTEKLRHYLSDSMASDPRLILSDVRASGAPFSLADPAAAKTQILDYMKAGGLLAGRQESAGAGSQAAADSGSQVAFGADSQAAADFGPDAPGRALRHGPTIASLPSRQLPARSILASAENFAAGLAGASGIAEVFTDGTDKYLLGSYVLNTFNYSGAGRNSDHFFIREAEYILSGRLTDRENLQDAESALRLLRLPSNLSHIYADAEKRDALAAAAEVLTPGAAAVLTQSALAAAWAWAESVNDARLLLHGRRVPLLKDRASWAIDLKHVVEDTGDGDGMVRPDTDQGLTYAEYLRILLFLEDEDMLTARILDLVQINMRKNVEGSFLISECCSGVSIRASVNRQEYSYENVYQRLLYR